MPGVCHGPSVDGPELVRRPAGGSTGRVGVIAIAMALVLSACGASGTAEEGDGVAADSSIEDYKRALADVEPITLSYQVGSAPESLYAKPAVAYADAVKEWSAGKITIELSYSGSRVPYGEMNNALQDELVDLGDHSPASAPEEFPLFAYLSQMMYIHEGSPIVGSLQLLSSWVEFAATSQDLTAEYTDHGIQPMLPLLPSSSSSLLCAKKPVSSLGDAKGALVRANGTSVAAEVKAIGGVNVDLPFTEMYDAVQRGTVDCQAASFTSHMNAGLFEVADYWTLDDNFQLVAGPAAFGFSLSRWESLPLVARQLLWDRLDVYLETFMKETMFGTIATALETAEKNGVKIVGVDDDLSSALRDYREKKTQELSASAEGGVDGEQTVATATDLHKKWLDIIRELDYPEDVSWNDVGAWLADNKLDFEPLVERLDQEVFAPNRPE